MAKKKIEDAETEIGDLRHGEADDVTRRSFRGTVAETDQVTVEIAGQRHLVLDIGSHGLGILLKAGNALVPGQTHLLTLALADQTLRLQGLVRHVTRDDEAGGFHCGIQLLDLDRESEQELQSFVLRQRHELFGGGHQ